MKSEIFAFSLLAFARGVFASPCLPPLTSSSETASTASSAESSIVSEESTTASTTTTASASESTSAPVTTEPEGFYVTIFRPFPGPGVITAPITVTTIKPQGDEPGTVIIETPVPVAPTADSTTAFTTTEFTTTSAVQSTTTSSEPEPQDTNLIVNGGFEANTPQPWAIFNNRNPGSLGISTEQPYVGQQSGTYEHTDNIEGEYWGIYQPLDNTRLIVGARYLVTMRIRVPDNSCQDLMIAPSMGNGGHMAQGSSVINVNDAVDNWLEVRAMFYYNRLAFIINDPGVAVISRCESVSFSVDDVSMVQFIVPTD